MKNKLKTFTVTLTRKQGKQLREAFLEALKENKLDSAAMLCQPVLWFGGMTHIEQNPPFIQVCVVTNAALKGVNALLQAAEGVAK